MKNDIEKIMEELSKGSDRIIVNPETLEKLNAKKGDDLKLLNNFTPICTYLII